MGGTSVQSLRGSSDPQIRPDSISTVTYRVAGNEVLSSFRIYACPQELERLGLGQPAGGEQSTSRYAIMASILFVAEEAYLLQPI